MVYVDLVLSTISFEIERLCRGSAYSLRAVWPPTRRIGSGPVGRCRDGDRRDAGRAGLGQAARGGGSTMAPSPGGAMVSRLMQDACAPEPPSGRVVALFWQEAMDGDAD